MCDGICQNFISQELSVHLSRITGVKQELPIEIQDIGKLDTPSILLKLDTDLDGEESHVYIEKNILMIEGGDQRGLYFGVMEFLEFLGCRWFAPGEDHTIYPELNEISIPTNWQFRHKPAMKWRGYHICGTGKDRKGDHITHYDYDTALWMIRNRMNFKPIHNTEYDEIAPILSETLLTPLAFGHSYRDWVTKDEHERFPEYSPLIDGERMKGGQLCLSNQAMRQLLVDRIIKYIDEHELLPIISLAPEDGYRWCECPECRAMDSRDDIDKLETNRRNHLFSAEIAKAVGKRRPGKSISTISYCNYLDAARDVPFEENLTVSMCITRALNKVLDDDSSLSNSVFRKRLELWLEKAGQVFWSVYYLSYGGTFPRAYDNYSTILC